jgi:flagellar protein FlgJ
MSAGSANANTTAAAVATDFSQFAGLRAAAKRNDPAALKQAAKQFEALLTEMVLKTAHQTKLGDDLTGEQGDLYQDMFDQQMALHLSSGKGLGLADMLVRQLGGLQGAAAAPGAASSAAAPGAVPGTTSAALSRQTSAYTSSSASTASAASVPAASAQAFVEAVRPQAEKAAAQLGVPAQALIAQAALETGWGQHMASSKDGVSGVNLFGVKAQAGWSGASQTHQTSEYRNGQWSSETAAFRSYGSVAESFDGYVKFLQSNPRYAQALQSGSVQGFAHGLQSAGYATDPQYAQKLIKVAQSVQASGPSSGNFGGRSNGRLNSV